MTDLDPYGFPIIEDGTHYRIVRSPHWPHEYRVVWKAANLFRTCFTLRGARRVKAKLERRP